MSRYLFDHLPIIGDRFARAARLLLCFDYDGTLTPFVDEPATAFLSPQFERLLHALATQEATTVAVISGRERADLQRRVSIPGLIYAGNHGLEINGPGFVFVEPTAVAQREALQTLASDLAARLQPLDGAFVENKGLTLSVHYRLVAAPMVEEVRRIVHSLLASNDHPFCVTTGNKVYEIRPRAYWNKGAAVMWIKEQLNAADALTLYLGDDTTDEDAFAALTGDITVKVSVDAETTAQYHVEGPAEVRRLLEWLVELLRQRPLYAAAAARAADQAASCQE